MSLVQSPFLSLSNTRKHGIPAFICTGARIGISKISIHPRYSPQPPGCTSVEQVRSASATPTLRNQKVSVILTQKLSELFKAADSRGYDWAMVENLRRENSSTQRKTEQRLGKSPPILQYKSKVSVTYMNSTNTASIHACMQLYSAYCYMSALQVKGESS